MNWFGSTYYLKLYRHRNFDEAKSFIDVLLQYLKPQSDNHFIDVCCGRGRHAIYLASKGYNVIGVDSSEESIQDAKHFEGAKLHFMVGDIRNTLHATQIDFALNLFTSFGYFEDDADNLKSLININGSLKPGGSLVIDYLNEAKAAQELVPNESQEIDGISFEISRNSNEKFITKTIVVHDKQQVFTFKEQVRRFSKTDFEHMLQHAGFDVLGVFGNYQLAAFSPENSDRLIIHAIKRS